MPDVSNPPGLTESGDVDHDETQGGTEGNPHAQSADTNHGNEAHAESYITSGEAPVQSVNGETGNVTVGGIPSGLIAMWSGSVSNVPSGWTLCDGTDGAPDLRNRFVAGAGDEYTVGDTGGEKEHQLTVAEMPSHTHNAISSGYGLGSNGTQLEEREEPTSSTGGDQPHENRPRFYALAYIFKL